MSDCVRKIKTGGQMWKWCRSTRKVIIISYFTEMYRMILFGSAFLFNIIFVFLFLCVDLLFVHLCSDLNWISTNRISKRQMSAMCVDDGATERKDELTVKLLQQLVSTLQTQTYTQSLIPVVGWISIVVLVSSQSPNLYQERDAFFPKLNQSHYHH